MSCTTLVTLGTAACQAPLSMGFPRQENWTGLPFPFPGDHPNSGIEPWSPALQADPLLTQLKITHKTSFLIHNQHPTLHLKLFSHVQPLPSTTTLKKGEGPLGVPIPDLGSPQDAGRSWGLSLPSASIRMEAQ